MRSTKLRLIDLKKKLSSCDIDEAYDWLGFDYSQVQSEDAHSSTPTKARAEFCRRFQWRIPPDDVNLRRLFNQVNTYYAERWVLTNCFAEPQQAICECSRLLLYRQGKPIGLRRKYIEFGFRSHLDFLDPWRNEPWLRGLPPEFLPRAIGKWSRVIEHASRTPEMVVFLCNVLIAIHPFSDANGRCARLIFTWLRRRWGLPVSWMNEAGDGEVLQTGQGIASTTYLMAMFMLSLMRGHNEVSPGDSRKISRIRGNEMWQELSTQLDDVLSTNFTFAKSADFLALYTHFQSDAHIVSQTPRFRALETVLR